MAAVSASTMRRRVRLALPALLCACSLAGPAPAAEDVAGWFRQDMAGVTDALKWRRPELTDETLFAAAALGLVMPPRVDGRPLLEVERKKIVLAAPTDRYLGMRSARTLGDQKAAFSYALSVVLSPSADDEWRDAYDLLSRYPADLDRAMAGVLHAPDNLPLLPGLRYAAADVLVWRASPRLMPLLMTLAGSSDRYIRSRGIAGLGVAAYRAPRGGAGGSPAGTDVPLREWSVSAVQSRMVAEIVRDAARDGNHRVRAAAALALGLMGNEADVPVLERLMRDKAYLALPTPGGAEKRVVFPVREQAAAALRRFGQDPDPGGGVFGGKQLKQATRGGKDVTNDWRDVRKEVVSHVRFGQAAW